MCYLSKKTNAGVTTKEFQNPKGNRETNQLKEWIKDEKTTSVPPSKGVISNFGFFSKHLFTDFVKIRSICNHIIISREEFE
jgi:hypothetical protein